jgi:hypothetical protein
LRETMENSWFPLTPPTSIGAKGVYQKSKNWSGI